MLTRESCNNKHYKDFHDYLPALEEKKKKILLLSGMITMNIFN